MATKEEIQNDLLEIINIQTIKVSIDNNNAVSEIPNASFYDNNTSIKLPIYIRSELTSDTFI